MEILMNRFESFFWIQAAGCLCVAAQTWGYFERKRSQCALLKKEKRKKLTWNSPEQRNFLAWALFMVPFSWSCSTAVRKILLISSDTFLQALSLLVFAALLDSIWDEQEPEEGQADRTLITHWGTPVILAYARISGLTRGSLLCHSTLNTIIKVSKKTGCFNFLAFNFYYVFISC